MTNYIIKTARGFAVVTCDDERHQTTIRLGADMAPAHTAFERGVCDVAVRRCLAHPSSMRYRTLGDVCEAYDWSMGAAQAARIAARHERFK
jgi:hypothetical protein